MTKTTTTKRAELSTEAEKFLHTMLVAMAEYAHDEQLRRMRAGRERQKQQGRR